MSKLYPFILFFCTTCFFSCKKEDPINDPGNPNNPNNGNVNVTGISITTPAHVISQLNVAKQLNANILPSNATNKTIIWESSDTSIAKVNALGIVTFHAFGKVTITASSQDNLSAFSSIVLYCLQQYDVHVVGKGAIAGYQNIAIYWKNGQANPLVTNSSALGFSASSVTMNGNDIYISGISNVTINNFSYSRVTLWKNGIPMYLTPPVNGDTIFSTGKITASGNNIYVAGGRWYYSGCPGTGGTGCQYTSNGYFWTINGNNISQTAITKPNFNTSCNTIESIAGDLYITGSFFDNFYSTACFWKNNSADITSLTTSGSYAGANTMIEVNNDLYFGGADGCTNFGCISSARIWKNNISNLIPLTDGRYNSAINQLAKINTEIYGCGYETDALGVSIPKYWKIKNNTVTSYPLTNQIAGNATSIAIKNNDIFICGYITNPDGLQVAKCWRVIDDIVLDEPLNIPDPAMTSYANDIYVN